MSPELLPRLAALSCLLLAGCGSTPLPPAPPIIVVAPAPAAPAPEPVAIPVPVTVPATPSPAELALAQADRLRTLSVPELAQEITRLGEAGNDPSRQLQLAMALALTRVPSDLQRAQGLVQRVLATPGEDARALHPLARLLAAQYGEQRRAEESTERQAQQLRDAQRRIDQLSDRLDAVRAIERSLSRPPGPPAPRAP